jgi:hypothetical protein
MYHLRRIRARENCQVLQVWCVVARPDRAEDARMKLQAGMVMIGVLAGSALASAEPMGQPGQLVITGDAKFGFTSQSTSVPNGGTNPDSITTLLFAPALDYFIAPNVSIGGAAVYEHESQGSTSISGYGAEARAGYLIHLAPNISWWPVVGLEYARADIDLGMGTTGTGSKVSILVFAPVVIHPVEHFFFGVGPAFTTDLTSSVDAGGMSGDADKTTNIGVTSVVGGYF